MNTTIITTTVDSPLGPLTLSAADGVLVGLYMHGQRHAPAGPSDQRRDDAWFCRHHQPTHRLLPG